MTSDKYTKLDEEVSGQTQNQQPGIGEEMSPKPIYDDSNYKGSGKLKGKVALITGGDSGIGRAVSVAFAKEGANVAIVYLDENEQEDAEKTVQHIEEYGVKAIRIKTDLSDDENCQNTVDQVIQEFGQLNILVNNAGKQFPTEDFLKITPDQLQ